MMKRTVSGFLLLSACLLFGASVWEGSAIVAGGGELPESGYYVSTNSFPRNTIVDVKNLETEKTVRAIVAGGLNSPGLLVALSKEAADAIGLNARGVGRVRVTMPADPIAFSRFTEGLAENPDPDRNPRAAIKAAGAEPLDVSDQPTQDKEPVVTSAEDVPDGNMELSTEAPVAVPPLELVDETEIIPEKPELAQSDATSVQEELSSEPVDIPDDYVPPPAIVEMEPEAAPPIVEDEILVELDPVPEPEILVEAPPDTGIVDTEEAAILEDAGSAALSVLDRLPEPSAEDALPVLDLETPDTIETPVHALSSPDATIEISETAEPEIVEVTDPIAETDPTIESGTQPLPTMAQEEPELLEPAAEQVVTEAIVETAPPQPQPEPGTVDLVLVPAEERPPEAPVELVEETFVEPVAEPALEPQQTQVTEETTSIDSGLIVEAIPPATAPALMQPAEPELPVPLDFIEPIPALPAAKPAVAATLPQVVVPPVVVPQVEVPQNQVKLAEKTVKPIVLFKAPIVEKLEKGKYYVQLGAFGKADSVNGVLASIGEVFPAAIQTGGTVEKPVYRVFVGPVNLGESGALLMRFRKSGYPDAFVKEGS